MRQVVPFRSIRSILGVLLLAGPAASPTAAAAQAAPQPRTTVVILGVGHSAQLVAEAQQPAAMRAFFDRVRPAAIGVERPPEAYARADHYEFTYEIQDLTIPYAREHRIPLYPIDWTPPLEDQLLGFGLDLERPPFVRAKSGFQGFVSFPDTATLHFPLYFAEADSVRQEARDWSDRRSERAGWDMPRRLFLYRTFLQAQRIARMAAEHRGETVLVVIGSLHKDDVEQILSGDPRIEIVQPSSFGVPTAADLEAGVRREDLLAIASFNLLGVQSTGGAVNWDWLERVIARLQREDQMPEARLMAVRLGVLTGRIQPRDAAREYARIREAAVPGVRFTWDGVRDRSRLDSFFDPFGNLTVAQRAGVELARELYKAGERKRAEEVRERVAEGLTVLQRQQLRAYWEVYVVAMR